MITKGMFSSNTDLWATPQDFFDELDKEFHFNLDPCALPENAKCDKFFTPEQDGLKQSWGGVQRVLQPSIRKGNIIMGEEMLRGKQKTEYEGSDADTCKNGYIVLP